jgi:hypothetical protein
MSIGERHRATALRCSPDIAANLEHGPSALIVDVGEWDIATAALAICSDSRSGYASRTLATQLDQTAISST